MRSQGCQLGYSGTRVQRRASDGPARRHDRNRLVDRQLLGEGHRADLAPHIGMDGLLAFGLK